MSVINKFEEKINRYIQEENMLRKNDKVVVGVSGGADSMCLLQVLYLLKVDVVAVHINHCIRGEEADKDEQFVLEECKKRNIKCIVFREKVEEIAKKKKLTEEEAGRMVRYNAFRSVMKDCNANKIAVAHNMNDNAETMLFNLFRGSGIAGLGGIKPTNVEIIRPLLCVERKEIEKYLFEKNIKFKTDRTNFEEDYTRNKIRLNILPYVEENINKKAIKHMSDMAAMARETEEFLSNYVESLFDKIVNIDDKNIYCIDVELFKKEKKIIQKRLVRYVINCIISRLKDIEAIHVESIVDLLEKQVNKYVMLPYGLVAKRDYDCIKIFVDNDFFCCKEKNLHRNIDKTDNNGGEILDYILDFSENTEKSIYLEYLDMYLSFCLMKCEKNQNVPKNIYTKWFDYDKIYNVVKVRNRKQGDYIVLNQSGGRKKLKDFFIDSKIEKDLRDKIPLLTDGSHVLWVIGMRNSEAYRIDDNTKRILEVKLKKDLED